MGARGHALAHARLAQEPGDAAFLAPLAPRAPIGPHAEAATSAARSREAPRDQGAQMRVALHDRLSN